MNCIDAILILGHRLEPGDLPSDDLIRRIDCAAEYWKSTNAPLIMPCGGITDGHNRTEASVMKEMLMAQGVPTPEGPYREQKFAEEKRFYAALREKRESGMSESEIIHRTING